MDLFVDVPRAGVISKHVPVLCAEAGEATYTRHTDIDLWSQLPGVLIFVTILTLTDDVSK